MKLSFDFIKFTFKIGVFLLFHLISFLVNAQKFSNNLNAINQNNNTTSNNLNNKNTNFINNNTDTLKKDSTKVDLSKLIYKTKYEVYRLSKPLSIDTATLWTDSLNDLASFHEQENWNFLKMNIGNSNSEYYSLFFNSNYRIGAALLHPFLNSFFLNEKELGYFSCTNPVSSIYYQLGPKQEQEIKLWHSNNLTKYFNFTLYYNKKFSPGIFNGQLNTHSSFGMNENYRSKNGKWQNEVFVTFNKTVFNDNGGILNTSYLNDNEYDFRRLIPTFYGSTSSLQPTKNSSTIQHFDKFNQAKSTLRRMIGKEKYFYNEDSTKKNYEFISNSYLEYSIDFKGQKYQFFDLNPDSLNYLLLGNYSFYYGDSVQSNFKLNQIENVFAYRFNTNIKTTKLRLYLGLKTDFNKFVNYNIIQKFINTSALGNASLELKKIALDVNSQIYFLGKNKGDFILDIQGRWIDSQTNLKNIKFYFTQSLSSPYLFQTQYSSNYFSFQNLNLNKTFQQKIELNLEYKKVNLGLSTTSILNYIYLKHNDFSAPEYINYSNLIQLIQMKFENKMHINKFHFDNKIYAQWFSKNAPLNLPNLLASHKVYLESYLFSHNLHINTGLQIDWTSNYKRTYYEPMFQNFSFNNTSNNGMFYNFSYFADMRISRAKIFLLLSNLQRVFTNNFSLNYSSDYSLSQTHFYNPSQNLSLRLGIEWFMIN